MSTAADSGDTSAAPVGVPVADRIYTPDDLLKMDTSCELVDGRLVERNMGTLSCRIAHIINSRLEIFTQEHQLGAVFGGDCSYQAFGDDGSNVRKPDGSFVLKGRFPNDVFPEGHTQFAPDLVLEVVSPNDLAREVDAKVEEYIQAGIPLIWVVFPDTQHVLVYQLDKDVKRLGIEDELSGESVVPGFSLALSKVFPSKPTTPA